MPRALVLLLLTLLACGGCTRPSDPLEWKIDAATPADFNAWLDDALPTMPYDLQQEIPKAFNEFVLASGRAGYARSMGDTNDPLCRQVNRKTVRRALLAAYSLETERLQRLIVQDSDLLLHELQESNASDVTPEKATQAQAQADRRRREIDGAKRRLAEVALRIKALQSDAPSRP